MRLNTQRGRIWLRLVLTLCALVVLGAALVFYGAQTRLQTPVNPGEQALVYEVASGASFSRVARDFEQLGAYPYPRLLSLYARWRGDAAKIKAGEYAIAPGQSVDGLLRQLTGGDVIKYSVTIVEGWTFRQMLGALAAQPQLAATLAGHSDEQIMAALGRSGEHPEGRFFPDTYVFSKGTPDIKILRRAYSAMAQRLERAWPDRDPDTLLREPYEALVLASIIEKETGRDDERRAISGVIHRRLKRKMRLQMDPTVIYGLGPDFDGNITRRDLRTDSPYNTYTRGGLPPTPIALVGQASLDAALHPAAGDSLYFVATGDPDGSHYFSATLAEHEQALARYLKKIRSRPRK